MTNNDTSGVVSLQAAIAALRKDLKQAAQAAQGRSEDEFRFRVSAAEIELTVVAEDALTGGGEVGFWVIKGKAEMSAKNAVTHKVKLTLNVGDIEVASSDSTI